MTPQPSLNPYICFSLANLDQEAARVAKKGMLLMHAYHEAYNSGDDSESVRQGADMLALPILVAEAIGDRIIDGQDAKVVWQNFTILTQRTLGLYISERGK